MDIDLKEEIRKQDELLAEYLRVIEIQERTNPGTEKNDRISGRSYLKDHRYHKRHLTRTLLEEHTCLILMITLHFCAG